jgi:hypothetical protein
MCETCSMNARGERRMQQNFEVVNNFVKGMLNCTLRERKMRPQI